jgi:hypothetical protein
MPHTTELRRNLAELRRTLSELRRTLLCCRILLSYAAPKELHHTVLIYSPYLSYAEP